MRFGTLRAAINDVEMYNYTPLSTTESNYASSSLSPRTNRGNLETASSSFIDGDAYDTLMVLDDSLSGLADIASVSLIVSSFFPAQLCTIALRNHVKSPYTTVPITLYHTL